MQEAAPASPPQRVRRRWPIWTAAGLLLCSSGYLLSQKTPNGGSTNQAQNKQGKGNAGGRRGPGGPIPVGTTQVRKGSIGVFINGLGTVTPVYTVTVASRVAGQLVDVRYREGQIVKKGQVLAVIDPRPYQAVVTQAQGQLARDQAMLKNASIDLSRYTNALATHAVPEQTVATQQSLVEQYQGTVKLDQGNLEAAQVNLDYATITAPITGRVGLRTVDPGNIVPANGTTGIATITQLQPITVIFPIAEDYINQVVTEMRAGHKLRVDALDRSNQTEITAGTVLTVDNQIDPSTGTVRVRASFSNAHYELFPNEFVNARLLVKTLQGVNLVPTAAIQRNNDQAFVYAVDSGTNTVHTHNIGITTVNGDTAAVTGVDPGQVLVIDGFDRLTEGAKVAVRAEPVQGGSTRATATPAQQQ